MNFKNNIHTRELILVGLIGVLLVIQFFDIDIKSRFNIGGKEQAFVAQEQEDELTEVPLERMVLPSKGITLPVQWNDLGKQMVEAGVIDKEKFEALYSGRGGLSEYGEALLSKEGNGNITMTQQNAGEILNLLWAFGLANKNPILEQGPMVDERYGGDASRFASTGGWSLSKGNVMDHYSKHAFVILTSEQQELVERVSKNIYRPCCGNSVYFPDCNHGMAMLGLLELLAFQGVTEEQMYKAALQANSFWFPDTYLTLAKYFEQKGIAWNDVSAKEILRSAYSGAIGYQKILAEVEPVQSRSGGSCGI